MSYRFAPWCASALLDASSRPTPTARTMNRLLFRLLCMCATSFLRIKLPEKLLVLETDELDQLSVEHDPLVHPDGKWHRVRLRIVDGDVDFQLAVVDPPEPLGHLAGVVGRAAPDIVRPSVLEPRRLHDQRVLVPLPDRVAVPPRLRVVRGQGP